MCGTETYAESTSPTTKTTNVPFSPNEAYALTNIEQSTAPRSDLAPALRTTLNIFLMMSLLCNVRCRLLLTNNSAGRLL